MRRNDGVPEELVSRMFQGAAYDGENYQPYAPSYAVHPDTARRLSEGGLLGLEQFDPDSEDVFTSEVIRALCEPFLNGKKDYGDMPLMAYQLWNTLDWRKPLASPEVAQRFINKLGEEVMETIEAYQTLQRDSQSEEAKEEFISELGDTLFCATAAATILGADIERGTAVQLQEIYGNADRYPTLSHIDNKVNAGLNRRDELYPDGQYPYWIWSLANHEDTWEGDVSPPAILPVLCRPLIDAMMPQAEADLVVGVGSPYRDAVESFAGKLWVYAAFWGRYYADIPLSGVIKKNMAKISGRVVQGSLDDKTKRTSDTL